MEGKPVEVERWGKFKVWLYSLFRRPAGNLAAVDWLELGPGDRFLDIGCGLGTALEAAVAAGAEAAGVDPSPGMVERSRLLVPTADVRLGSAEELPFPDSSFTAVLSIATFHHWSNQEGGLAELARVLTPGGRALIVEGILGKGHGHGLDQAGAERVVGILEGLGLRASAAPRKVGRAEYLVITISR